MSRTPWLVGAGLTVLTTVSVGALAAPAQAAIYGFAGDDFLDGGYAGGGLRQKDKVNGGPGQDHCATGRGGTLTACEEGM